MFEFPVMLLVAEANEPRPGFCADGMVPERVPGPVTEVMPDWPEEYPV